MTSRDEDRDFLDSTWNRAMERRIREGKTQRLDEEEAKSPSSRTRQGERSYPREVGPRFWRDMERRTREGRTVRLDEEDATVPIAQESVTFADEDGRRDPRTRVDNWSYEFQSRRGRSPKR